MTRHFQSVMPCQWTTGASTYDISDLEFRGGRSICGHCVYRGYWSFEDELGKELSTCGQEDFESMDELMKLSLSGSAVLSCSKPEGFYGVR